ncbi:MAG TPA: hypothetical protein VFF30_01395 [Nitrososphaerales archaeon]|nr:hypothetical protein [Nitrososphaerales archaeon]
MLYAAVGWGSGIATALIFRNALRTFFLRKATRPYQERKYALIWVWWVAFYVIVYLSFNFLPKDALSILYALLSSVEIFIYYGLKMSFQDKIPIEGKLVLWSYGVCVVSSFFVSLFPSAFFFILAVIWTINIAVWLFCALYSLRQASDELAALVY